MKSRVLAASKLTAVTGLAYFLSGAVPSSYRAFALGAGDLAKRSLAVTPDVQLVIDYNNFIQSTFTDWDTQKSGLHKYITNRTILHEAKSLPWGGTMVGYDGWHRLNKRNVEILKALLPNLEIADSTYFQSGSTVIHEYGMIIKGTHEAPEPFVMGMIEKYNVKNGRIAQIDEFYEDTAGLLKRLGALGIVHDQPM